MSQPYLVERGKIGCDQNVKVKSWIGQADGHILIYSLLKEAEFRQIDMMVTRLVMSKK